MKNKAFSILMALVLICTMGLPFSPFSTILPANADTTWITKTSMSEARTSAATGVIDGILYVAGGGDQYGTGATNTLQSYNPANDTWSTLASMPEGRYGNVGGVIDGKLYVAGGWDWPASGLPKSQLFVYDPAINDWDALTNMPILSGSGGAGVIDGKLYVITPCDGYNGYRQFLHVYNPSTNAWTQLASTTYSHVNPAFGVIDNKLYVVGGINDSGVPHGQLEVYDPVANTWTTKAPLPVPAVSLAGGTAYNGKLYAIGGSNNTTGSAYDSVYIYDPVADSWTTGTAMPTARVCATAAVINGVLYVAGGNNSSGTTIGTNEAFTLAVPASTEPIAYWTFDNDNANDSVGTNHGTLVGTGMTFTPGKVGHALNFSGDSGQYVEIPSLNLPSITVEAWVNPSKYGYYTSIVTKSYYLDSWNNPWDAWELWLNEDTPNPCFRPCAVSPDPATMGQWIHMAGTYDGVNSRLYVNGELKASVAVGTPLANTPGNIYIGPPKHSNHTYRGLIDEVAIWDHALTATEIQQHYQNGLNGQGYLSQSTTGSISGTITDANSLVGISGATVMVGTYVQGGLPDFGPEVSTTTNSDGTYTIPNLPAGDYFVWASDASHATTLWGNTYNWFQTQPVTVTAGTDTPNIDIAMAPAGSISGRVTDSSGTPLDGIHLFAESSPLGAGAGVAVTDENGYYTMTGLAYGTFWIQAPAPYYAFGAGTDDFLYQVEYWQEQTSQADATILDVNASSNPTGINFTLELGGSISGYVYELDGETPIAGAEVIAGINSTEGTRQMLQGAPAGQTATDASGHYIVNGLPAGDYYLAAVAANHELRYYPDTVYLKEVQPVTVTVGQDNPGKNFSLGPGGTISGHIIDQDTQQALADVSVVSLQLQGQGQATSFTLTDQNGDYTLEGVPYGDYAVASPWFIRLGSGDANYIMEVWEENLFNETADIVHVASGNNPTGINFTLTAGGTISGHIYDEADGTTPIVGAVVQAFSFDSLSGQWNNCGMGVTDEDGYYITTGLPPDIYGVRALATGYGAEWYSNTPFKEGAIPVEVTLLNDTPDKDFTLEQGGSISGTVTADGDGAIANCHVSATDSVTGKWVNGVNTDASGNYTLNNLPPGDYRIKACPSCSGLSNIDEWYDNTLNENEATIIHVAAGESVIGKNFGLGGGGIISGRVTDKDGNPITSDVTAQSRSLDAGWHKFVYRVEEGIGGSIARAAFKAPEDIDWRWFSTSELDIRTAPNGATPGITLTTKKNNWVDRHPTNPGEMVQCVDVDATPEVGWYGQSVVQAINQSENIHGNDDNFTSYYEGYFYVAETGTWWFSTDSDDASDIRIDDQLAASWYSGHMAANRWERKIMVEASDYANSKANNKGVITALDGTYSITGLPAGTYRVNARVPGWVSEYYQEAAYYDSASQVVLASGETESNINFTLERSGIILGIIKNADGTATLPNVSVECRRITDGPNDWRGGTTDSAGNFVIGGPYGEYIVRAPGGGRWGSGDDNYLMEYYNEQISEGSANTVTVGAVPPANITFTLEQGGSISGTVTDKDGNPITYDKSFGSIELSTGWHNFIYRVEEGNGASIARVAFKAPGDADWKWFSTSNLELRDGPAIGLTLTTKKNNWVDSHPRNPAEMVQCVDVDATAEEGWYGQSVVTAVNQSENIHGNDDNFTSYYYGDFYVDTAGAWIFSTDSDDASDIRIDGQIVASWYDGHGAANRWERKILVEVSDYADPKAYYKGVFTELDGTYSITGLPAGTYRVNARVPGWVSEYYQETPYANLADPLILTIGDTKPDTNFTLEQAGIIVGTIKNAAGTDPLPNVSVECRRITDGPNDWHGSTTDSNGNFVIGGIPWGDYVVRAPGGGRWGSGDDGYIMEYYDTQTSEGSANTVNVGTTPPSTITFTLEQGGTISGTVTAEVGDGAIANCHVFVSDYATGQGKWAANTDENGIYTIIGIPAGTYRLRACASCSSLPYANEFYNNTYNNNLPEMITLTTGQNITDMDFSLAPGGSISGNVTSQVGGANLANISVDCRRTSDGPNGWWWGASTDTQGNFTISGLPYGDYIVRSPIGWGSGDNGYIMEFYNNQPSESNASTVTIDATHNPTGINFTLDAGGSISGSVKKADNSPIANLHLYAEDSTTGVWTSGTQTDSEGNYTIHGLPGGAYFVRACASCVNQLFVDEWWDNTPYRNQATAIPVTVGEDTGGKNFVLETAGTVSGYITRTSDGEPLADVRVEAIVWDSVIIPGGMISLNSVTTDVNGYYIINLPAGDYAIRASQGGYATEWYDNKYFPTTSPYSYNANKVTVTASQSMPGIDFSMEAGGSISGQVRGVSGTGIGGAFIMIGNYSGGGNYGSTTTDSGGFYQFGGLASGQYAVRVAASGYASEWYNETSGEIYTKEEASAVTVAAPGDTPNTDFDLISGGTISGRVTSTASGNGLAGVMVQVINAQGYLMGTGGTNDNGDYTTTGIVSGQYKVKVVSPGFITEWYNNAYNEADADLVTVTASQNTPNIIFGLETVGAVTTVYINPPNKEVSPGEAFTVEVKVDPAVAIAGAQFDLTFDPSLITINKVEEGNLLQQNGANTYFSAGTINNTNGTITGVAGAILGAGETVSTSDTFAIIFLTAKTVEAEGTSLLDLSNVIVGDANQQAVPITVTDSNVTVTPYEDWDVNTDNHVNVLDMIGIGQNWGATGTPHWIRADVKRDGVIDVFDMILIGQHWTG